jgi:glycosyltransferase involved in cell wall biosynthesis
MNDYKTGTSEDRHFDGIICFGGVDWWYHNRGHYDLQMMGEFSDQVPVLYVNSIGMRRHKIKEGHMFFKRIKRKSKSLFHGLKTVRKNFGVFTPFFMPFFHNFDTGYYLLAYQVNKAARKLNIRSPLVWVTCPTAVKALKYISYSALICQRTDIHESDPDVNREEIETYDKQLKSLADLTLFCSQALFEKEKTFCKKAALVDHGVDYHRFSMAGEKAKEPDDIKLIPRPRIGYIGNIDAHTFDPDLFNKVASRLSNYSFVLVGPCTLREKWCKLSNIHLLGQRKYELIADYMASCDVLIMPWNNSEWIKSCNPVKLKEYLAVGKPVVSTLFDELNKYKGLVLVARSADEFIRAIDQALTHPVDPEQQRERVRKDTWNAKTNMIIEELKKLKIFVEVQT